MADHFPWLRNSNSDPPATVEEPSPSVATEANPSPDNMVVTRSRSYEEGELESAAPAAPSGDNTTPAANDDGNTDNDNDGNDGSGTGDNQPMDIDRSLEIFVPRVGKHFPAPDRFDEADWSERATSNLELWGRAPWFDSAVLDEEWLMQSYVDEHDMLPGNIPLSALGSEVWRRCYSVADDELHVPAGRTLSGVRGEFAYAVYNGIDRLLTFEEIPADARMDLFVYRTRGEMSYVDALQQLSPALVESWRGKCEPDQRAVLMDRPQLRREFRYLRKTNDYWTKYIRNERRARVATDLLIPHHANTYHHMRAVVRPGKWASANEYWRRVEVPRGCRAELPPVVSYRNSALQDPNHGLWMTVYNGFAVKAASFILQDVYDKYRLWSIPPRLMTLIRGLDLSTVLGNRENTEELDRLLGVIEETDFSVLPNSWTSRGGGEGVRRPLGGLCLGRRGAGGDFVYYDPWAQRKLSDAEAAQKMRGPRRPLPVGHPIGNDFATEWNPTAGMDATEGEGEYFSGRTPPGSPRNERAGPSEDAHEWVAPTAGPSQAAQGSEAQAGPSSSTGAQAGTSWYPMGSTGAPSWYPGNFPQVNPTMTPMGGPMNMNPWLFVPPEGSIGELTVIRRFLRSCGVDEVTVSNGSAAELRGYVRGRMDL